MGGVRNGKSAGTPEPAAAPQGPPQPGAPDVKPAEDASEAVDRHLRAAARLLREGSAARAFGELARVSRTQPMTPRLAAALVHFSLLAGTEAAAITLLDSVPAAVAPEVRRAVHRQLARVLRRVGQVPRAIAALEALLEARPEDRRARRTLETLRAHEVTDGRRAAPEEPAPVLGKLPTRKAGVQAPAVWEDEDSGYRVETVVEPPGGVPTDTQPSVPREPTAVAFPALSPAREAEDSEPALPSPESRTRTEIEIPALGALADPPTEALTPESRARTETELPIPGGARVPPASGPRSKAEAEAEPRRTEVELPALGLEARGRATDETTGEITSEALPLSPASPVDTQELSASDLEAALQRAKDSGAVPPARTVDVPWPVAPSRAPGSEGARAEDAEELARSQKLEAQLIARQAWRELAQLYLKRADRARDASARAEALTRLAEVMENELQDFAGAARMYREIVELTGDRAALREQVRLLSTRGDVSLVRRALDEAIRRARTDRARAAALLTRGERWLFMGDLRQAREDFEAANALSPGMLPVLAGLFRCATDAERPAATERLRAALAAAPRRSPDRLEGLRVLAQAAEEPQGDPRLAQWAWNEVLAESPGNEQAQGKLLALARRLGDTASLGQLLRAQLSREPRGPAARQARLELVATLDARGDDEGALSELRQAVRFEPGHKEAWLLLVERLTARGNMGEAAWALEHAATSMEDERERERAWERLARLWREVLGNAERAQVFSRRAEGLRKAREEREPPAPPEPPRGAAPLVPPPPALALDTAAMEGLADEVTSNTDPIAAPLKGEAPAAEGERTQPRAPLPEEAAENAAQSPAAPGARAPGGAAPSAPATAARAAASGGAASPSSSFAATPKLERVTPPASTGASSAPAAKAAPPVGAGAPGGASANKAERASPPSSAGAAAPAAKAERAASPISTSTPAVAPSAPAGKAERAASPASTSAAAVAPSAPAGKAERAVPSGSTAAVVPSAPAGKAERAVPSGSTAAVAPSAPAGKAERAAGAAPAGAPSASAPRAERPSAATSGPAVPGGRGPQRPGAPAAPPTASSSAAPAASPPARADKAPVSPRAAPPSGDGEPSLATARARGGARASAPPSAEAPRKPEAPAEPEARSAKAPDPTPSQEDLDLDDEPVPNTRVISWEAPPGRMDPVRRIVRPRQEGPAPAAPDKGRTFIAKPPAAPEPRDPPARPGTAETRESPMATGASAPPDDEPPALRHIRERPLDPKPYRQLTELFDVQGDTARASLMREIADALEGRESTVPRVQRPPLTTEERAGLRHPGLRTASGELLACTGLALCRLFPAQGRAAGVLEPLRGASGPGAAGVLEALHGSARLLDVHLPEIVLSDDDGPHFTAVHARHPRLLVGRAAVRQALPAAELRFHAGRALLSLSPDLLALRTLKGAQLLRALALLTTVLKDPRAAGDEARVVRESLSPRALERAVSLLEPGTRDFDASALADAARDSANRAGLVACGGVGPAVAALRTRRSHDAELVELLRFAASERYLPLRAPR